MLSGALLGNGSPLTSPELLTEPMPVARLLMSIIQVSVHQGLLASPSLSPDDPGVDEALFP